MTINTGFKVLAGAVALAIAGTASANTSNNGDIFLNIVDGTNKSSFYFDTGISAATFAGTSSLPNFDLSTDANYQAFKAAAGSDSLNYSVVGTIFQGSVFTSTSAPVAQVGNSVNDSNTQAGQYASQVANVASTTTNSAYATVLAAPFALWSNGSIAYEGNFVADLAIDNDAADIGTALHFYSESTTRPASATNTAATTIGTFAGSWKLDSAGVLSYTTTAVPLPTPLVLLLSGLGMMGLVGRRRQSDTSARFNGAAV